ncbi:hypothetical protein C8D87_1011237 [Lentzea atacamensis]|uniref:Uncharacterized protein n=1 Tax=Lentzea atacamensis TaxID=531938 RepID=A0ABX9ELB5_9PSEU|nr:hypothetical protein C8D87_1011237 [Lentzea atacamensis]
MVVAAAMIGPRFPNRPARCALAGARPDGRTAGPDPFSEIPLRHQVEPDRQPFRPAVEQRLDQLHRLPGGPEATDQHGLPVGGARHGLARVHASSSSTRRATANAWLAAGTPQ